MSRFFFDHLIRVSSMDVETKVIALTTGAALLMVGGLTWSLLGIVPKVAPARAPVALETDGSGGSTEGIPLNRERPGDLDRTGFKNAYPSTGKSGERNGATMNFPKSPARAREFTTADFAPADLNSDGYLSRDEWKRAGQAPFLFDQVDENHNGRIEMQEAAHAIKTNPLLGRREGEQ